MAVSMCFFASKVDRLIERGSIGPEGTTLDGLTESITNAPLDEYKAPEYCFVSLLNLFSVSTAFFISRVSHTTDDETLNKAFEAPNQTRR